MSHEPNDQSELLIASLLQRALERRETAEDASSELREPLAEALGAAMFLQNTAKPALLSEAELGQIAQDVQREAAQRSGGSAQEEHAARQLRLALEREDFSSDNALQETLSTASYLKNASSALGEDFLLQLGREVEAEAKAKLAEPAATEHEERAADVLRHVLDGNQRVIASEPITREVSAALATATYLRNASKAQLLSTEQLTAIQKEVQQEAQQRTQRRRRLAFLGGASFLALAASVVFLVGPIFKGPRGQNDAKFPTPPTLTQEILPGSDPLERLDPMYEAGLRGLREARFLGAQYASQSAH